nr:creatininase family protein [Nocardia farcinica]
MRELLTTATSTDEAACGASVVPVGSFEQHGDHLPLITDTAIACLIATELSATYPVFVLPPITVSCSHEHEGFPGTVRSAPPASSP